MKTECYTKRRLLQKGTIGMFLLMAMGGTSYNQVMASPGALKEAVEVNNTEREVNVTGTVTAVSDGLPLPGVTVKVKGTTTGTATDLDGKYSLNVPDEGAVLVFSFVGFESQEIPVEGRSVINVDLSEDLEDLNEVVVVGYGTQNKASVSGSIATVGEDAFVSRAAANPLAALQGQVPGMSITRSSGQPGEEGYDFKIRGLTSLNATDPLVIVDDVPYTNADAISSLNPNDIESMTVLKDASAAIYGARAAGGVILITTKKGKTGKPQVTFNTRFTLKTPGLDKTLTNRRQYFEMFDEASENDGVANRWDQQGYGEYFLNGYDGALSPTVFGFDYPYDQTFADNNWQDVLWGNNTMMANNLSIAGKTDKSNYRISIGHIDDQGLLQWGNNSVKRTSVRANYGMDITEKLKVSTVLSYEREKTVEPSLMDRVLTDFDPPFIASENPLGQPYTWMNVATPNWLAELGGDSYVTRNRLSANLKLDYDVNEDLKLVGVGGAKYWSNDSKYWENIVTFYNWDGVPLVDQPSRSRAGQGSNVTNYFNYSAYADYNKTLGKHYINVMAGGSFEQNDYDAFSAYRYDLISSEIHTLNTGAADQQFNDATANAWAIGSAFGRLNYDYDGKYFLEANVRHDGSSRFAPGYQWDTFGGVMAAWRISEEDFMKGVGFIDNLKLRASYGSVGNQSGIGLYDYIPSITLGNNYYPFGESPQFINAAVTSGLVSLDRTWERVITKNIGVDFGVLGNRLTGSFDYFVKDNPNMLVGVTYPAVLGDNAPDTNSGHLKTWGYEAVLGWRDKVGDFSYHIDLVYFDNRTELLSMEGADSYQAGYVRTREGYPINSYFGYISDGFITSEDELAEYMTMPGVPQQLALGDAKYKDLDGNGRINVYGENEGEEGDVVFLGDSDPHHNFSLNTGFNWKNFDFTAIFQGVAQRDVIRDPGNTLSSPFRRWWKNQNSLFYDNTWSEERPNAPYPRLTLNGGVRSWNYNASDRLIQSGAYMRLKNLIVGYSLPQSVLDKIKIQKVRVYFNGTDIWETTGIKDGFDPEKNINSNVSYYPFYRTYTLGLDITF
ncbi:SusC/RagA family TonB-linked outer membrane protein [Echinicola strongylocentroti]|nr:TonB-dependent receptor [Echinicola strongylocentroti]